MVGWMLLALLVAAVLGIGGVLLLLYALGIFRSRVDFSLSHAPAPEDERFPFVLTGLTSSIAAEGRPTGFWVEADAIFGARLAAIRAAKKTILLETFFMTPGRRADDLAAALAERARDGVEVRMLVDDYGVKDVPDGYWAQLEAAGVSILRFRRFSWRAPLDYMSRTHRKLLVVDGTVALIGGAGFSDWWDGCPEHGDVAPWRDFEMRWEGAMVGVLAGVFMTNWAAEGGTVDLRRSLFHEAREDGGGPYAYVTPGEYGLDGSALRMFFHVCILAARQRMWLASPYYLPMDSTVHAICLAAERGVDVRILTMGPATDRPYVYHAAREGYRRMLEAGVRIYEYQPSMMHAKAMLLDDCWISTGSANFDPLSFFHNNELNVSHGDKQAREQLKRFFEESFERSELVTYERWCRRPWRERVDGRVWRLARRLL